MKRLPTAPLLRLGPHGPELLILGSLQAGAPQYESTDEARAAWAATKTMPGGKVVQLPLPLFDEYERAA